MMLIKAAVILATVCLSRAVYTRWGREVCPGSSTLVYSGYAGGAYYDRAGSAAEFVCLPKDPKHLTGISSRKKAYISGAEYRYDALNNWDVPCAICLEPKASQSFMIPARDSCNSGWSMAYKGMLASGFNGDEGASQYICVDDQAEGIPGSGRLEDGKLIYPVASLCLTGLKCPPYKEDEILACVVCVKN